MSLTIPKGAAVSYTHLDVYKRQVIIWGGEQTNGKVVHWLRGAVPP